MGFQIIMNVIKNHKPVIVNKPLHKEYCFKSKTEWREECFQQRVYSVNYLFRTNWKMWFYGGEVVLYNLHVLDNIVLYLK